MYGKSPDSFSVFVEDFVNMDASGTVYAEKICSPQTSIPPLILCGEGRSIPQPICDFEEVPESSGSDILIATQPGSCIPTSSQVKNCVTSPSECICPSAFATSSNIQFGRCGVPSANIDVYISNQIPDLELQFVNQSDRIESSLSTTRERCWTTPPPSSIGSKDTGFARAYVVDNDTQCGNNATVTVRFEYTFVLPVASSSSNIRLSVTACRFRVGTSSCGNGTCSAENVGEVTIGGYGAIGSGCISNLVQIFGDTENRYQVETTVSESQMFIVLRLNDSDNGGGDVNTTVLIAVGAILLSVLLIVIALIFFFFFI
jgi:hypothetical protein